MINFLFITLLAVQFHPLPSNKKGSNDFNYIDSNIFGKDITAIKKKYNLSIYGAGGSLWGFINRAALSFQYDKPITEEEAIQLYYAIQRELVQKANAHKELRPYFIKYPLDEENFDIKLLCTQTESGKIHISTFRGKLDIDKYEKN